SGAVSIVSKQYTKMIEQLAEKFNPDFIAEELGDRSKKSVENCDFLADLFQSRNVPYVAVEMSENANDYIRATSSTLNLLNELQKVINEKMGSPEHDEYFRNLLLWHQYLTYQKEEIEDDLRTTIREAWFTMGILEKAGEMKKDDLTVFLITNEYHFKGLESLFEKLGIRYEEIRIEREVQKLEKLSIRSIRNTQPPIEIRIKQTKKKKKNKFNTILYFFDTDLVASPFDVNMAYDAGFDIVYPISKANAEIAGKLTSDVIFSRGPKGTNYTAIMIGGNDIIEAEKIFSKVKKAMFPPFQVPVVMDPKGAYTTAAAGVIKVIEALNCPDANCLDVKVAVLGTGPVGKICSLLAAEAGCDVLLVETGPESAGFSQKTAEKAVELCKELNDTVTITPAFAPDEETMREVLSDREIVFACGAAGIELISKELRHSLHCTVYLDFNATPPSGINGLKPSWDKKPFKDQENVIGIGALAIGDLKRQIEDLVLSRAKQAENKTLYGYREIFELACESRPKIDQQLSFTVNHYH
ncbi:MAG: NAD(P)-dependent methylenetetrahydromethanopterin dehydrogenase, partial [Candidatus Odinarchaeota archaeon]